jgi:feruloyl esterase
LEDFFRAFVFDDVEWDISKVKLDDVWSLAKNKLIAGENLEEILRAEINWEAFSQTNTKMLMYYGWADHAVLPELGIELYEEALGKMGGDAAKTQDFLRLFMVPGMLHCGDGPGANVFGQWGRPGLKNDAQHDIINALETWVEAGVAPETIIATKYVDNNLKNGIEFTRPLCVFPKVPVYKGIGDINAASSFECRKGATPQ